MIDTPFPPSASAIFSAFFAAHLDDLCSWRYNAWSTVVLDEMIATLNRANADPAILAVVMTGRGKYYCSGADFSDAMEPMLPSSLVSFTKKRNYSIFEAFLSFTKPLICALNGPAIGTFRPCCVHVSVL